jgi:hypothetical protein
MNSVELAPLTAVAATNVKESIHDELGSDGAVIIPNDEREGLSAWCDHCAVTCGLTLLCVGAC